jgi:Zn finger protein HypA/HybF involved in hydrogenase expression
MLRKFRCKNCNNEYEKVCEVGLHPDAECPKCHSQEKEFLVGAFTTAVREENEKEIEAHNYISKEFKCLECDLIYEELCLHDESEKYKNIKCPKCKSKKKTSVLTKVPGFSFANPVGTDRWNNEQKGHDYRFKYMQPRVKEERENAEKKSHMGKDVYKNHDDISGGQHFDPKNW